MFLDLDGFKRVNDSVGHVEGDQLLRRVGALLKLQVGEKGFVARVGGDEFTLLFPDTSGVAAVEVAEGILEALRTPHLVGGQEFIVTTSIGVTVFPHDGEDADTLLRNADVAMYRAKEQGRDNYQLYTSSMTTRIFERLVMESDMRRGLKRKEFVVYYQPQLDANTGEILGVEALVRWQHPERGLILPGEFIPLAEETGLILDLGEHVIRTVCTQAKRWAKKEFPLKRVAINLSAHRFRESQSMEPIHNILSRTGCEPSNVQFEITESALMENREAASEMLNALREMGASIAVDDFGTGYSSLSYLKRLPIDVVKIDRSFIRDITEDHNDRAIVSTVVAMAHGLGLTVVAEGVETEEQLALIRELGCDAWQGFLFSKAVPPEELEALVAKHMSRLKAGAAAD
jgi:diguanylate cyclase (GGDEF)-like protein